jgi:transcriptional regulator with XRE-family HTH domain
LTDNQQPNERRTRQRRCTTGDRALGHRIRRFRNELGLSQQVTAHRIGRSGRWMIQVENGRADPNYGDLVNLAEVLEVGIDALVLDPRAATASGRAVKTAGDAGIMSWDAWIGPADRSDAMKRRRFLRAGVTLTSATVAASLGLWPGPQESSADATAMAALRNALLHYGHEPRSEAPDLAWLERSVHAAWADRQASRYSSALRVASSILTEARFAVDESSPDQRPSAHRLLAQAYRLAFDVLRKVGDTELALIAADRGMLAARRNGDPAVVAEAAGCLGVVLSGCRHHAQAIGICRDAAAGLESVALRSGAPDLLSMYGQVLLSGAEVAAESGDRPLSDDLYRDAERIAGRLGEDGNHGHTAFGPTNVAVHRIHASVVLGDGEAAIHRAKHVDPARLPVLERRSHHLLDVARAHSLLGNADQSLAAVLTADEMAPEEIRLDPAARLLVHDLGQRSRWHASQLSSLASRMGVHMRPGGAPLSLT